MKRNLFAVIGLAIASISLATTTPANAREYRRLTTSRFDQSCSNARVVNDVLEADCLTDDGRLNYTNIMLEGIQNIDGNLVPSNSNQISSFSESCGEFYVIGNELRATCRTRYGGLKETSIALNDIDNIDGTLRYRYRYSNASYIIPQMF
ncbi:MAG: CVNH domain-containing protein [Cyanobacteria bacterium P01_C01_bin.38]